MQVNLVSLGMMDPSGPIWSEFVLQFDEEAIA